MDKKTQSIATLVIALTVIIAAVVLLEGIKPQVPKNENNTSVSVQTKEGRQQDATRRPAKELAGIQGYINTDENISIQKLIGKQVIMVDFWTYSCINCIRTQPYLNAWQEKYGDKGLTIIGVHTPEFEFEKKIENVQKAVSDEKITYPVVLDNNYATWQAYQNRYWPRKYLIDINGFIVYDHIGEGAYEETETKIQELLEERNKVLGENSEIAKDVVGEHEKNTMPTSPETYFGALRNKTLANAEPGKTGIQNFQDPGQSIKPHMPYLVGTWDIQDEYAQNQSPSSKIIFRYQGQNVYMVASSGKASSPASVRILRDGQPITQLFGSDVYDGILSVNDERLYHVIQGDDGKEHTLELQIQNPGLQVFTFTFG